MNGDTKWQLEKSHVRIALRLLVNIKSTNHAFFWGTVFFFKLFLERDCMLKKESEKIMDQQFV